MSWEERETCYISKSPQGTDEWKRQRIGCISGSIVSYCVGRGNPRFTPLPEKLARQICGLEEKVFTPQQLLHMKRGNDLEPHVRKFDEKLKGVTIRETGVGVWKQDPRFRASMDGEIVGTDDFVEYKVPKRMYYFLLKRLREKNHPPGDYSHIFNSHYDQMIMNGVIHGKKRCSYMVICGETGNYYQEWIPIDYNHWYQVLYPKAVQFYERYIQPILDEHNISVVLPE